jgi:hypothetical protein
MNGFLMSLAKWLEHTDLAVSISGSTWAYPFVQWTHFSGLSLWLGTNFALDLRLMGLGRKRNTAAELSNALFAWNWAGFAVALCGGFMLFASAATKYVVNPAFLLKLGVFVPLALVVHIANQQKAKIWGRTSDVPGIARCAGFIEFLLWLCVVTSAVSIPNFDN